MKRLKVFFKILISSVTVLGLIAVIYIFLTSPTFRIQPIEVKMVDEASYSQVFSKIKKPLDNLLSQFTGQFVWDLDLEKVMRVALSDLRIKDVKVSRTLPNRIQVLITPHMPILNVLGNKTRVLHPIARNGEVLPDVQATDAPDGPILRGEFFLHEKDLRMKAIELMLALQETGSLSQRTVSEISFDKKKGFQLYLQNSKLVVWVGSEDFKTRIGQAHRVVDYLQGEHLAGRIIDARYNKKVVVRLRNDP